MCNQNLRRVHVEPEHFASLVPDKKKEQQHANLAQRIKSAIPFRWTKIFD